MPLQTDLSITPYHDDYNAIKQYYKMLFQPGLSVQTRELNQMQTMHQVQIERFADNIFKRGTITDGCNFAFHNDYPYIKILDNDLDGVTIDPSLYVGKKVRNSANLEAYVINSYEGFEATDPDLNTLYINYTNSGNTNNLNSFTAGETFTVFDPNYGVFSANVVAGGTGFANTDTLIVVPAIVVTVATGTISNGDYIGDPATGANVEVIEADYTTYATANQVILRIKPRNADLANASVNATAWTISQYANLTNSGNTIAAYVVETIGSSLEGGIITNGIGKVTEVTITNVGDSYTIAPHLTVQSANNLTGINALNLTAKNYYAQAKIASVANSVGSGYAFSIGEGVIYQQGYMQKVLPQIVVVEKYNNSPNNVVVGFTTTESIVTANEDESLFDNALGSNNYNAPGADRLKLEPTLVVLESEVAKSNTEFNILVEWSNGQPYRQNRSTQYSRLGDEMAQRTFDESGNYVIDTFQIATAPTANTLNDAKYYTVVVDPGQAYISGYKVQTLRNYYIDVQKGTDTKTTNNIISLNYGNYVRINEVGGLFQFSTGDQVELYSSPKTFLSNTSLIVAGNTTPQGTLIGYARARSLIRENGIPGDPTAIYRLFLFDVQMNAGQNFKSVKSIYYNGATNKGIADVVLTSTAQAANIAILNGTDKEKLLFSAGVESLKNSANTSYIYRTIDQTTSFANTGLAVKSIAATPNETYPYTSALSDSQMGDLFVIPIGNNLVQYTSLTGTIDANTTRATVIGSGTSFFNDFAPGDYINYGSNATANTIKKIVSITNGTFMTLDSNTGFTNAACTFRRVFPKNVPIPFGSRTGLSANVDANSNILTLKLAHTNGTSITLEGTVTVNTAIAVNIQRTNVTATAKTANRNKFVKIYTGNNTGNTVGPWALGVSDVMRLRNVYVGNSTVNTTTGVNITKNFYIDHNQTSNYLDISWLYKKPRTQYSLNATSYLLCEFDYYTRAGDGYFDTTSYLGTSNSEQIAVLDALPLANLTSTSPSLEVPEVYTTKGEYYDLLNTFDFRPAVANTVAPNSDPASAPLNPGFTKSFGNTANPANDKKFPLPDGAMTTRVTQYMGRIDSVFISGESGEIYVLKGIPDVDPRRRYPANHPKESLKLQTITVPSYPNITDNVGPIQVGVLRTGLANERFSGIRLAGKLITPILSSYEFQLSQPMVYTMEDIANLERRIKDLEYYVSLSILETSITNKIIPSSIDKSLNRFKFGFFADDFSTEMYSDLANPQYAASYEVEGDSPWGITRSPLETEQNWADADKVNPDSKLLTPTKLIQKATNRVVPPKLIWSKTHTIKNLPYIDEVIIDQNYATDETVISSECVPKTVNVVVASSNGYLYQTYESVKQITSNTIPFVVNFGSRSGTATIYFDNSIGYTSISVYKGATLVASTNASAALVTNLTAADKALLQSTGNQTAFKLQPTVIDFERSGNNVRHVGKFSFTHNATTGTEYIIQITAASTPNWKFLIEYPLTAASTTATKIDPCVITNTITSITAAPVQIPYLGTIKIISAFTGWSCSKAFSINGVLLSDIAMEVTGLKPMTQHKFYLDGVDYSAWCEPTGKPLSSSAQIAALLAGLGKPLTSGTDGKLNFSFLFPMYGAKTNANGRGIVQDGSAGAAGANWASAVVSNASKTSFGSSGYSTLMVAAQNSIATKLVAQRLPNSAIPATPAGNP